jgi:hypothetical protein
VAHGSQGHARPLQGVFHINEILKLASAFFAQAELDRRLK